MDHPDFESLSECYDAALDAAASALVASHLRVCASCRRQLQEIESIQRAARSLPRRSEPPAELWPAILSATRKQPGRIRPALRAAIVVGLLIGGTVIGLHSTRKADVAPDAELAAVLQANIRIVDTALNEAIATYRLNPDDQRVGRLVAHLHERKISLLQTALLHESLL